MKDVHPTNKLGLGNIDKGQYVNKNNGNENNEIGNSSNAEYEYIQFDKYAASQINGVSRGAIKAFETTDDHETMTEYCNSIRERCVGYAYHQDIGYQIYDKTAFPMQYASGWTFYLKHKKNSILNLTKTNLRPNKMESEFQLLFEKIGIISDFQMDENKSDIAHTKKYISYGMNAGRINNQLFSLEAMIQYAKVYNRTLVIPWPRHKNHEMGLECGMWDLSLLGSFIDFVIEHELPNHLKDYVNTKDPCRHHKLIGHGIPPDVNEKCEMIYLYEGEYGIFKFSDGPYDVMKYLMPAEYIRNAVQKFIKKEFNSDKLSYRVGVHRRAMDEGGVEKDTGVKYVCRWASHGIQGDVRFEWLRNYIKQISQNNETMYKMILGVYHHSCAMDFDDLQNILIFHKQQPIDVNNNEKYFVAHDHQEPDAIKELVKNGGIEQNSSYTNEWSHSKQAFLVHQQHCEEYKFCSNERELQSKEEILFDMWTLYYSEFLVGTWMSTLSRTICHWKGFDKSMYNGNQCWLYWKWKETVNNKNTNWFTLEGLNINALFDKKI